MNLLQGAPWLLAHRSMLKPNQPMKVSLYGNDYVIWQDNNNNINALPNACPHMGAMLKDGVTNSTIAAVLLFVHFMRCSSIEQAAQRCPDHKRKRCRKCNR